MRKQRTRQPGPVDFAGCEDWGIAKIASANATIDAAIAGMGYTLSFSDRGWKAFCKEFSPVHQRRALAVRAVYASRHAAATCLTGTCGGA